jgi:hypothetical protein
MAGEYDFVEPPSESLVDLHTHKKTRRGWEQPFTLKDAYQDRPPTEYIVKGIFPLPSLNIAYGPPGSLKSMVGIDLGLSVASGQIWLPSLPGEKGLLGFQTKLSSVGWLDFDMGINKTHERIAAFAHTRKLPEDTPFYYLSLPTPTIDASNEKGMEKVREFVGENNLKLIFIDNLGTSSGGIDENSCQMIGVMANFRNLAEEFDSTVIIIHHQRKNNGNTGRMGDTLRGHSSIEASLDLALLVERKEGSDEIVIKPTKTRGADVKPFGAMFTYEDKENGELLSARFFGKRIMDTNSDSAIEEEIRNGLYGKSMNQSELVSTIKPKLTVGENRIIKVLEKMEKSKELKTTTGQRNAKIYELANHSSSVS